MSLIIATLVLVPRVSAYDIMHHHGISVRSDDRQPCAAQMTLQLNAPNASHFRSDRVDLQEVARMGKTYLWLDCQSIEVLILEGIANGELVYLGRARQSENWRLRELALDEQPKSGVVD